MTPRATYRVQLSKLFGFAEVARAASYLAALGISHVYSSSYLRSRPDSEHGYDVTNHTELNPELGEERAFLAMIAAFRTNTLEHILDYVPNHMGVGGADNPLWLDVLEWGRQSRYANFFDIDWDSPLEQLRGKVLVPFLANQYGIELAAGKLRPKFDAEKGEFSVWLYDRHKLPIVPWTYSQILANQEEFGWLTEKCNGSGRSLDECQQRGLAIKQRLAQMAKTHAAAIGEAIAKLTGVEGQSDSWKALADLIDRQNWRPAFYRVAADAINYRRFFSINELAAIRMDLPEVFDYAHHLVLELINQGMLQGLRIDHIDGLYDPQHYLERLRAHAGASAYLVVEKILAGSEKLREDWPIQGTTGYEFSSQVLGLVIDPRGEATLTDFYREFTSQYESFSEIAFASKLSILDNELAGELETLSLAAAAIAKRNPSTVDFTRHILWRALRGIIANFPVYRTYVNAAPPNEVDRRYIHWAVAQASKSDPEIDIAFKFLETLLNGSYAEGKDPDLAQKATDLAMKVQQLSGPVMAKGLEDTAFYRYNRFIALNEVGSSPTQFACSVSRFHKENQHRAEAWPHTMLSTSTHDTKHGEDARARLAAISLVPERWTRQVVAWSRILRARRGDIEGIAPPTRNDEYLFYQNLSATWPAEFTHFASLDRDALTTYTKRIQRAMQKSLREAGVHTNWTNPNTAYETAVDEFISGALNPETSDVFLRKFLAFQRQISRWGMHNSLVQVLLKTCSPGVPDFYQGSELWNLSFQDPDNRGPVDFDVRQKMLAKVQKQLVRNRSAAFKRYFRSWEDGSIKLALTATLLDFRQRNRELFDTGSYEPLTISDEEDTPLCAFRRTAGDQTCVAIASLNAGIRPVNFTQRFAVRGCESVCEWREVLTGRPVVSTDGQLAAAQVLEVLPVALLAPSTGTHAAV